METGDRNFMTLDEAAAYVGCSTKTLRRRISDGTLRAYRVGPRLLRINPADLDAMFNVITVWREKEGE